MKNQTSMELAGDSELIISRMFDAPPRIVFDAWTRAELVKRWWAPKSRDVEMVSCDADVRVGGSYRYVLQKGSDAPFAFSGEYIEVDPPTRLVYTQIFEPMAGMGSVTVTVTFKETENGHTRMTSHELYSSKEVRDAALGSGMEHGMRETMDQLDELVASLA